MRTGLSYPRPSHPSNAEIHPRMHGTLDSWLEDAGRGYDPFPRARDSTILIDM